ncbi:MAG: hypothetical protein IJ087_01135 [Eggerthellaceae bacterium]|nr:hypothetical protein [Eggerthellaceae bacterium]
MIAAALKTLGFGHLATSVREWGIASLASKIDELDERTLVALAACAESQACQLNEEMRLCEANRSKKIAIDAYHASSRFNRGHVKELARLIEKEAIFRALEMDDFDAAEKLYWHAARFLERLSEHTMMPGDFEELADVYEALLTVLEANGKTPEMEVVTRRLILLRKRASRYSRKR